MTYIDRNLLRFLMQDVHGVADLFDYPYYQEHDVEGSELMVDSALQIADTYLYPIFEEMDRKEPELEDGTIKVHPRVRPLIDAMAEAGWIGAPAPFEWGGMQVPEMVYMAATLIFQAANNGAMGFTGLTTGSANLIKSFGSEELKKTYLEKMYGGQYQGTMALTEPQAGSSLSDITSSASPLRDGSYNIKGQKIFHYGRRP